VANLLAPFVVDKLLEFLDADPPCPFLKNILTFPSFINLTAFFFAPFYLTDKGYLYPGAHLEGQATTSS